MLQYVSCLSILDFPFDLTPSKFVDILDECDYDDKSVIILDVMPCWYLLLLDVVVM